MPRELGRNEPCHCGSGKKYKQCCLAKDEAAEREARAKRGEAPVEEAPAEASKHHAPAPPAPRQPTSQPWRREFKNTRGFARTNAPRRSGGS
jgi:hypothetical protein